MFADSEHARYDRAACKVVSETTTHRGAGAVRPKSGDGRSVHAALRPAQAGSGLLWDQMHVKRGQDACKTAAEPTYHSRAGARHVCPHAGSNIPTHAALRPAKAGLACLLMASMPNVRMPVRMHACEVLFEPTHRHAAKSDCARPASGTGVAAQVTWQPAEAVLGYLLIKAIPSVVRMHAR